MKPHLVSPDIEPSPPGPPPPVNPAPIGTPWSAIGPLPHDTKPAQLHTAVMDVVQGTVAMETPAIVREQPMSCTIGATASPTLLLLSIVGVGAIVRRARRRR